MRSIRLASLLAVLLPVSALAVPVTYEFTGTLTSYQTDGDITDNPFPYGTEFFGSFTLEDSTVPFTDIGFTGYLDAVTAASISFGSGGSLGSFQHTGSLLEFSDYSSNLVFLNDFEYMGNPERCLEIPWALIARSISPWAVPTQACCPRACLSPIRCPPPS